MMPFCAASVTASNKPERVEVSPLPVPMINERKTEESETDSEGKLDTVNEERKKETYRKNE